MKVTENDARLSVGPRVPRLHPVRHHEPLSFTEIAALVVIATAVGFLAGVALALVLG